MDAREKLQRPVDKTNHLELHMVEALKVVRAEIRTIARELARRRAEIDES